MPDISVRGTRIQIASPAPVQVVPGAGAAGLAVAQVAGAVQNLAVVVAESQKNKAVLEATSLAMRANEEFVESWHKNPGDLQEFEKAIAQQRANVEQLVQERDFSPLASERIKQELEKSALATQQRIFKSALTENNKRIVSSANEVIEQHAVLAARADATVAQRLNARAEIEDKVFDLVSTGAITEGRGRDWLDQQFRVIDETRIRELANIDPSVALAEVKNEEATPFDGTIRGEAIRQRLIAVTEKLSKKKPDRQTRANNEVNQLMQNAINATSQEGVEEATTRMDLAIGEVGGEDRKSAERKLQATRQYADSRRALEEGDANDDPLGWAKRNRIDSSGLSDSRDVPRVQSLNRDLKSRATRIAEADRADLGLRLDDALGAIQGDGGSPEEFARYTALAKEFVRKGYAAPGKEKEDLEALPEMLGRFQSTIAGLPRQTASEQLVAINSFSGDTAEGSQKLRAQMRQQLSTAATKVNERQMNSKYADEWPGTTAERAKLQQRKGVRQLRLLTAEQGSRLRELVGGAKSTDEITVGLKALEPEFGKFLPEALSHGIRTGDVPVTARIWGNLTTEGQIAAMAAISDRTRAGKRETLAVGGADIPTFNLIYQREWNDKAHLFRHLTPASQIELRAAFRDVAVGLSITTTDSAAEVSEKAFEAFLTNYQVAGDGSTLIPQSVAPATEDAELMIMGATIGLRRAAAEKQLTDIFGRAVLDTPDAFTPRFDEKTKTFFFTSQGGNGMTVDLAGADGKRVAFTPEEAVVIAKSVGGLENLAARLDLLIGPGL